MIEFDEVFYSRFLEYMLLLYVAAVITANNKGKQDVFRVRGTTSSNKIRIKS